MERADRLRYAWTKFSEEYAASIFREEVLFILVIFRYGERRTKYEVETVGK